MPIKYQLPEFLETVVTRDAYIRWLDRKARAPVKRDKNRGNVTAQLSEYKIAIYEAVLRSESKGFYTGELLDWHLIGQYDNVKSKEV